jgi:large subunit ribosomal protein L30
MSTVKVRLTRSKIGCSPRQRATLAALGLHKINQVRELPDNQATQGMIRKVTHLVEVIH